MSCIAVLEKVRQRFKTSVKGKAHLTQRESEVLVLVSEAYSNKQIASELGISVKTVEKHRGSLARFTDTHNPIELYKWAMVHGYCEPPERVDK